MANDQIEIDVTLFIPDSLRIRKVEDRSLLETWMSVLKTGFDISVDFIYGLLQAFIVFACGHSSNNFHYLGWVGF